LVQCEYVELVQDVITVMAAYYDVRDVRAQPTRLSDYNMQP